MYKRQDQIFESARSASFEMIKLTLENRNQALQDFAELIQINSEKLLAENAKDLEEQKGKIRMYSLLVY
mgnify:CR=1 FL=1